MIKVTLKEFNETNDEFDTVKEMELGALPSNSDLIVAEVDGIPYAYEVYDCHLADNGYVDVNVFRVSALSDYQNDNKPALREVFEELQERELVEA